MRDHIVAIVLATCRSYGIVAKANGGDQRDVALEVMRHARDHFLAPDEGEAFAASVGCLWELYPDDETIRQETKAIGDRNKLMGALLSGVPVDFDAVKLTEVPAAAVGLIELWAETDPARGRDREAIGSRNVETLQAGAPHLLAPDEQREGGGADAA